MSKATATALPTCPASSRIHTYTRLSSEHTFSFTNDSPIEIYVTFRGTLRDSRGHTIATYVQQGELVVSGQLKEYVKPFVEVFIYDDPGGVTLIAESEIVDHFSGTVYHYAANSCHFVVS